MKARIARREREKRANGTLNNPTKPSIEENESTSLPNAFVVNHKTENIASNGHLTPRLHISCSKNKSDDANSSYSSSSGLDNLTIQGVDNFNFECSFVDIPLADETKETSGESVPKSKLPSSFHPPYESSPVTYHVVKETKTHTVNKPLPNENEHANRHVTNETNHDKFIRRVSNETKDKQVKLKHLPPECLAVKKLLRRHSYELAISDYSWLPDNPPSYASCVEITNAYNHGYRHREKKYSLGCENRGYDKDDHKISVAF